MRPIKSKISDVLAAMLSAWENAGSELLSLRGAIVCFLSRQEPAPLRARHARHIEQPPSANIHCIRKIKSTPGSAAAALFSVILSLVLFFLCGALEAMRVHTPRLQTFRCRPGEARRA
jgi:hypothetical protein